MRCYTFGNYYMSSIQQGIQAAHSVSELFVKYQDSGIYFVRDYEPSIGEYVYQQKVDDLYDWVENHKTIVCLSGGNSQGLKDIVSLFVSNDNNFPWSAFYEDEESLDGILTNVAIILPPSIYETAAKIRSGEYILYSNRCYDKYCTDISNYTNSIIILTQFETKLIILLNSCQLAR